MGGLADLLFLKVLPFLLVGNHEALGLVGIRHGGGGEKRGVVVREETAEEEWRVQKKRDDDPFNVVLVRLRAASGFQAAIEGTRQAAIGGARQAAIGGARQAAIGGALEGLEGHLSRD